MRSVVGTVAAAAAAAAAVLAGVATATDNTTSGTPTVNLFINDSLDGDAGYAASIISACSDQTVYGLQCTSGPVGAETCGPNAPVVTVTEGKDIYFVSVVTKTHVAGVDATATVWESCHLDGTTAASCSASISVKAQGEETATATSTVLTGSDYHRFDVLITGGADKTASATGSCNDKGSAAPGINARVAAAVGMLGAVSAAALLAL